MLFLLVKSEELNIRCIILRCSQNENSFAQRNCCGVEKNIPIFNTNRRNNCYKNPICIISKEYYCGVRRSILGKTQENIMYHNLPDSLLYLALLIESIM